MPSREIPKDEWKQFFNEFSRRHEGRFVTIHLAGADFNFVMLAEKVPFKRITPDFSRDEIVVMTGADPYHGIGHGYAQDGVQIYKNKEGISYTIESPAGIWLFQEENGTDESLGIYADAGTLQVLLHSPPDQGGLM